MENINKLKKIILYFLSIIFIIVLLYRCISNMFLFYLISIVFILIISNKFKFKNFGIFLFVFSLLLRLIAISIINPPIESDFLTMYNASKQLLLGKKDYLNLPYFINWGYQMGHVIYQYFLLKIIDSVLFLKVINCIIHSGIVVLIYNISKCLTNEKCARISSLIYTIFLFPLLLNTVLTNQQLAAFCMLLGIYLFISPKFDSLNKLFRNIIMIYYVLIKMENNLLCK